GVIFGLAPALNMSHPGALAVLRASGRGLTAARHMRGAFVVVQIALTLVLLVGAGLLINSFSRLGGVQAGFDTRRLMTFQVPFPRSFFTWAGNQSYEVELTPRIDGLSESIRARLSAIPNVESATLTVTPPLGGGTPRMEFVPGGRLPASSEREGFSAAWYPTGTTISGRSVFRSSADAILRWTMPSEDGLSPSSIRRWPRRSGPERIRSASRFS